MTDEELERRFDALMRRINDNHEVALNLLTASEIEQRSLRSSLATLQGLVLELPAKVVDALQKPLIDRLTAVETRVRKLEDKAP